jgi:hypothetical protein
MRGNRLTPVRRECEAATVPTQRHPSWTVPHTNSEGNRQRLQRHVGPARGRSNGQLDGSIGEKQLKFRFPSDSLGGNHPQEHQHGGEKNAE